MSKNNFVVKYEKVVKSWWGIIICGLLFGLISPPYDSEMHWALSVVPLLSIPLLLPFISLALIEKKRLRFFSLWLWGTAATFARIYWLTNVTIEGKFGLIILAMILLSAFLGIWYTFAGMALASLKKKSGAFWVLVLPALWVVSDFLKTIGELSFPWMMQGYLFNSFVPLTQLASITGVWGITWIAILISTLLYSRFIEQNPQKNKEISTLVLLIIVTVWGVVRLQNKSDESIARVALIQSNVDHKNWDRETSLDNLMMITDSLVSSVDDSSVDLVILPESGIYTYLDRNWPRKREVMSWVERAQTPILLGTLDKIVDSTDTEYYNTAFLLRQNTINFEKYYKMKLVPVSEGIPYDWKFQILSRIKIVGGFSRGFENIEWEINDDFSVAPTICYEAIYPNFNRVRSANVDALVNITNDSWFGISPGPYQHASMARMRSIETGVPTVRCAASGVSFIIDGYGNFLQKSNLGERDVIIGDVPAKLRPTLYARFGDWFVWLNVMLLGVITIVRRNKKKV